MAAAAARGRAGAVGAGETSRELPRDGSPGMQPAVRAMLSVSKRGRDMKRGADPRGRHVWCGSGCALQGVGGAKADPQREPPPALSPLLLIGPSGCAFHPRPRKQAGALAEMNSKSRNCSFSRVYDVSPAVQIHLLYPSRLRRNCSSAAAAVIDCCQLWPFYWQGLRFCSASVLVA